MTNLAGQIVKKNKKRNTSVEDLSHLLFVSARPGIQLMWTLIVISTLIYTISAPKQKDLWMLSLLLVSFFALLAFNHYFPFKEYHPYVFFLLVCSALALITSITYLTGGRESLLGFLYFTVPIYAAAYYSYPGTLVVVVLTSLFRFAPFLSGNVRGVEWLSLSISIVAFFIVGILACHIVEGEKLYARESSEFKRLLEISRDRERELSLIYTLARRLSYTLEVDSVIRTTITLARKMLSCQGACAFLMEDDKPVLKAALGVLPFSHISSITLPEETWARELLQGSNVLVEKVMLDWLPIPYEQEGTFFDIAGVPIIRGGNVSGILLCFSPTGKGFREAQLDILSTISSQTAVAIDKALLYSRVLDDKTKLETILSALRDGLVLTDQNGNVLDSNTIAQKMLQVDTMGKEMTLEQILKGVVVSANIGKYDIDGVIQAVKKGSIITGELTLKGKPAGTVQAHFIPLTDSLNRVSGIVLFLHDITELKRADEMKSNFISNVSHELRTPLTHISGYVGLLLARRAGNITPQQEKYLKIIREQASNLTKMIEELLELSKTGAKRLEKPEKVEMRKVIEEAINNLSNFASAKEIEVKVIVPEELPMVSGSQHRLVQVVVNILENSIKFTAEKGVIQISAFENGPNVQVQVSDSGVGISPSALPHIFDRFFQAPTPGSGETKGFGLGLAICREIIEQHGGKIWAESEPGMGSTFTFTVPIFKE